MCAYVACVFAWAFVCTPVCVRVCALACLPVSPAYCGCALPPPPPPSRDSPEAPEPSSPESLTSVSSAPASVPDITSHTEYTLEEAKQKAEQDLLIAAAESKKMGVSWQARGSLDRVGAI